MSLTSIIIPTCDRPQLLVRAVASARLAGRSVEIVVVDDGSDDETRSVCETMQDIVYVRLDHRSGVGSARTAGIAASAGTYISFLDDDDARLPGSIDRQIAVFDEMPEAALVYGQMLRADQSLLVNGEAPFPQLCPSGDVFWMLISGNFIPSGAVVLRRSVLESIGGLAQEVAPADDWDLWLRIAERHSVAVLREPVSIYRQPTLWSRQGSSRLATGLQPAALRVLDRVSKLSRAQENPGAFLRAARRLKGTMCLHLLVETMQAARRGDAYALLSFRRALATASASLHAIAWPHTWRKIRERVRS
jgi:glycosyltransferase involved in cell wall biosynthesis